MLDGADPGGCHGRIGQDGAQAGIEHVVEAGCDVAVQVGAAEDDAMVGGGGPDGQVDAPAGMDADANAMIAVFSVRCRHPKKRRIRQSATGEPSIKGIPYGTSGIASAISLVSWFRRPRRVNDCCPV